MAVKEKYFYGTPGSYILAAPELSYVKILHVEREGTGHRVISIRPDPGERACQYVASLGQLIFDSDNPFFFDPAGTVFDSYETIYVLWKE